MIELKKELYSYAVNRVFGGLEEEMQGREAMETIGERVYGDASLFSFQFDEEAVKIFASQYDIPDSEISEMVRDTVIYTHGLALMMIFDGQKLPKKEACRMMFDLGAKLSKEIGITPRSDFDTLYRRN